MKLVCAWCRKVIREDRPGDSAKTSHGICPTCQEWLLGNDPKRTLEQFIDTFPMPVFFVDGSATVVSSNRAAREALGRSRSDLVGRPGGEALECAFARLPEGCGNTVHCGACTIRQCIMSTFETREPCKAVTAWQDILVAGRPTRMRFLVETRYREGGVLLRIDEMAPENTPGSGR